MQFNVQICQATYVGHNNENMDYKMGGLDLEKTRRRQAGA
jgi:hypothetical protein